MDLVEGVRISDKGRGRLGAVDLVEFEDDFGGVLAGLDGVDGDGRFGGRAVELAECFGGFFEIGERFFAVDLKL